MQWSTQIIKAFLPCRVQQNKLSKIKQNKTIPQMQDCKCKRGSRARGIPEIYWAIIAVQHALAEASRPDQFNPHQSRDTQGREADWIWALGTAVFLRCNPLVTGGGTLHLLCGSICACHIGDPLYPFSLQPLPFSLAACPYILPHSCCMAVPALCPLCLLPD